MCLGNIVRSPLAENMFRHMVKQAGLSDKYQVDSAGTSAWHIGEKPDSRMRRVAASHGFVYTGRARQFTISDFEGFDLIIAMDSNNQRKLMELAMIPEHREKIHQMRAFDPQGGHGLAVPDPYYGGIDGFEQVYQIIERSCQGLLTALENGKIS